MSNVKVLHGDCVELMRSMPDCSVDSIVTDPPYGLEFMGKDWDRPWAVSATNGVGYAGRDDLTLPSHRDSRNANCRACGGRMRGAKRCKCAKPEWDRHPRQDMVEFQQWFEYVAEEALRVLKPGGHLLAFGGTRTYHRMACAIEDAGFEIRDSIHWVYGSGFPKSLNIGKAIDKAAGAEREVVGHADPHDPRTAMARKMYGTDLQDEPGAGVPITAPATPEARRWEGWGTALKPAHEPIVVARKPLAGTVAGNVLVWGTGGLNIDGCRVPGSVPSVPQPEFNSPTGAIYGMKAGEGRNGEMSQASGRWPANVVFDRTAGEALDQQSGDRAHNPPATWRSDKEQGAEGWGNIGVRESGSVRGGYGDKGGASRFFTQADFGPDDWPFVYQAKPSRKERNAGLDGLPDKLKPYGNREPEDVPEEGDTPGSVNDKFTTRPAANHHPTVKPVALMRHLVRLVTPPGGTVLDPFAGSGTTLVAAVLEGFDAIGCEMTDEYLPIIEGRVAWAEEQAFIREELKKVAPQQPTLL